MCPSSGAASSVMYMQWCRSVLFEENNTDLTVSSHLKAYRVPRTGAVPRRYAVAQRRAPEVHVHHPRR